MRGTFLSKLPVVGTQARGTPQPKAETSRRKARDTRDAERDRQQRAFAAFVWDRDHSRCRWCGRRVIRSLDRVDTRGEVHHIHGRLGRLKFEPRAALLLCGTCHDKLTGRVNEKWKVMGTRYWTLDGATIIDATVPVDFVRIA